jgi:hypothetical protein
MERKTRWKYKRRKGGKKARRKEKKQIKKHTNRD